jgi:hypothetical protein
MTTGGLTEGAGTTLTVIPKTNGAALNITGR